MKKCMFLIVALGLAMPAFAAEADTAQKPPKPKKERKVCKTVPASHSRMGVRICRTKAQWDNAEGRNANDMESLKGSTSAN